MKIKNIVCIICIIIFLTLSYLVISGTNIKLDVIVYDFISKLVSNNLTHFLKFITNLGSAVVLILITILALIFLKNKKYGLALSINLALVTLLQFIFKNIFTRQRPFDISLIKEDGYSFPSGHSLTSVAFYGLIIYFIYNSNISKRLKKILITLLILLIIFIGISRIYLGVHYITDVLGGFTLGISYIIIYTSVLKFDFNTHK